MRWTMLLGLGILGIAFLVGTSDGGGEAKKNKDGKTTGYLPFGWKALNLSAAQKEKIYELQAKYKSKLDGLKDEEMKLKNEEKADLAKILTDEQKEQLKKLVVGEGIAPAPKKSSTEKAPEKQP